MCKLPPKGKKMKLLMMLATILSVASGSLPAAPLIVDTAYEQAVTQENAGGAHRKRAKPSQWLESGLRIVRMGEDCSAPENQLGQESHWLRIIKTASVVRHTHLNGAGSNTGLRNGKSQQGVLGRRCPDDDCRIFFDFLIGRECHCCFFCHTRRLQDVERKLTTGCGFSEGT